MLRRIIRRAVRAMRLLGVEDPVLPHLLPVSRDCMAPSYPELASDFERISTYAYAEEEAFRQTLRAGTTIFDNATAAMREAGSCAAARARARSSCTTPTASRSTSPSRWRPSRASASTRPASAS